jgi:thiol-disulfide isomerase/thioredoxin
LAVGLLIGLGVAGAVLVAVLGFLVPPEIAELDPILTSFQLDTLDGSRLGPPDLRGDVVVVDMWATWCKPCVTQAEILERLREEYAGRGVSFLALNSGEDPETVREYVEKTPFSYPVLLDPEGEVMGAAELYALPTLLVLDPRGDVSYLSIGITGASVVRNAIDKALAFASG